MKFEGEKQLQQRELDSLEGQLQLEKETFDILFRTRDSISTAKLT